MKKYFNILYEFDKSEIFRLIDTQIASNSSGYICVADGNILQMVHRDKEYRDTVNGAIFSICDSNWVPLYLKKLYGIEVRQYCGSQIFADIVGLRKYRQCFLGSRQQTLDALREKLLDKDPAVGDMLFKELPFCDVRDFDYAAIAREVRGSGADIVWVALGAPKQERFAQKLSAYLDHGVIIPVGAVFNFFSGTGIDRAPQWMIKHHIEFVHRIFKEPRKQLHRCLEIAISLPGILKEEIFARRAARS